MAMDEELKSKWTAALRSGEYKQAKHSFESDEGFCCLGVLCKVAGEPTLNDGAGNWNYVEAALGDYRLSYRLSSMNDIGDSFSAIADYIEANL